MNKSFEAKNILVGVLMIITKPRMDIRHQKYLARFFFGFCCEVYFKAINESASRLFLSD